MENPETRMERYFGVTDLSGKKYLINRLYAPMFYNVKRVRAVHNLICLIREMEGDRGVFGVKEVPEKTNEQIVEENRMDVLNKIKKDG